jgi:polyhydroxyalkanoate synthesis regulator protein
MSLKSGKTPIQALEEQKKRHQALSERATRLRVEFETATRQLQEAQQEAAKEFGTQNLDELRALYRTREEDNERKVFEFTLALDELEKSLAEAERQLLS